MRHDGEQRVHAGRVEAGSADDLWSVRGRQQAALACASACARADASGPHLLYLSPLAIITHSNAMGHITRATAVAIAPATRPRIAPRATRMTEPPKLEDLDPVETREWLESIDSVLKIHGPERAHYLLERLIDYTRRNGAYLPFKPNTAYVNSIPVGREPEYPGNRALERRIEAYIRWNALVMVLLANKKSVEYGGHLSSYASSATLYEVGFNHVWRAPWRTIRATCCSSRAIPRPASTAVPSSKGA
jgi:hypothetical protein